MFAFPDTVVYSMMCGHFVACGKRDEEACKRTTDSRSRRDAFLETTTCQTAASSMS